MYHFKAKSISKIHVTLLINTNIYKLQNMFIR